MDEARVEREILLEASPDEVWEALTDQDLLSSWFGAHVEIDRHRAALFKWEDGTARRAVVDVSEAPELLVLRWLPFEQDASGRTQHRRPAKIVFRLAPRPEGTLLRVVETGADDLGLLHAPRFAEAR